MSELSLLFAAVLLGGSQVAVGKVPEQAQVALQRGKVECRSLANHGLRARCLATRTESLPAQCGSGTD